MEADDIFISDRELDEVLNILREDFAMDFSGYARSSLSRRVARFKKNYHIATVADLKLYLVRFPNNLRTFLHEITVNTTEMFRDPEFWLCLRNDILPRLGNYNSIRIWHAGCSTGEEVYSMLILLHEAGLLQRSKVLATDINDDVLQRTKLGCFRERDYASYCRNYLESGGEQDFSSYFKRTEEHFCIREDLKAPLQFKAQSLIRQAPFSKFDLILCRNVMIYFNAQLQSEVVGLFAGSLFKEGFLCVGKKENIGLLETAAAFRVFNQSERIYWLR